MYRLILKEPGKSERILYSGSYDECEKERLEYSFEYSNSYLEIRKENNTYSFWVLILLIFIILINE